MNDLPFMGHNYCYTFNSAVCSTGIYFSRSTEGKLYMLVQYIVIVTEFVLCCDKHGTVIVLGLTLLQHAKLELACSA